MIRRRRWKAPPSGSTTGLVPNHDAINRVPSWASMFSAIAGASGLPLASMTSGTCSFTSSSGAAAVTPRLLAMARRHACGSAISGRHPERCNSRPVSSPSTPAPSTMTRSRYPGPASSVTCNAVSTSGNKVADAGSMAGSGISSPACAANTSWCGWNAKTAWPDSATSPTHAYP